MATGSKIFNSYRGLGLVCNDIPLEMNYFKRKSQHLIYTVIGNSVHTYLSSKLQLISISNPLKSPISCISVDAAGVYTACGNFIYLWKRNVEIVHSYKSDGDNMHLLMCFGDHILSVDIKNVLRIWEIKSEYLYLQVEFPENFQISCIMHPATYLNKVLLASKKGAMQLWNIRTSTMIYSFSGWYSEITVIVQAPAQDVVAVGMANGNIVLHDLKYDQTLIEFKQNWGRVTSISFRSDNAAVMVSGSELGHIAIWDLEERKLLSTIYNAHDKPVCGLKCLPNEPLMITNSPDNTIKMWIFDLPEGGARLYKLREGHSSPPQRIRFHGSQGNQIITAGEDSTMRIFSTITDVLNKSLGRASYNRKSSKRKGLNFHEGVMPPIIAFTSETMNEKSWDNIASLHRGKSVVTTWSIKEQKMGEHRLLHDRFKQKNMLNVEALCIELTVCGNYIIVGYDSGHLDKYNIQSGLYRGSYGESTAHDSVKAVVSDGINKFVISGGDEGRIKWWSFNGCKFISQIEMNDSITKMTLNRDSNLLAASLDDWSIYVVDIETRGIVRKYVGHNDQITDICISPDSRWLISSSMDHTIRTWDLPSSSCVDCFRVPVIASSISLSPVGDFLASIHCGHLGVYLWSNRACFQNISLNPLPGNFKPALLPLPSTGIDDGSAMIMDQIYSAENQIKYKSHEQISQELITLALLPTSRWMGLLDLDIIKRRNRPVEPAKVPKAAPFFIPTVPGLDMKFVHIQEDSKGEKSLQSLISSNFLTPFGVLLKDNKLEEAMDLLLEMGPSSIDVEIKALDPDTGGSEKIMLNFLEMIKLNLMKCKNFEAIEGYLGLYLKHHSNYIMNNMDLQETCQKLFNIHHSSWKQLKQNFNETLCLLSYFKNATLLHF